MQKEQIYEQQEKIEEVKSELNALAALIIQQTLDNLFHYCDNGDIQWFESLVTKVKNYKWGLILSEFLSMVRMKQLNENYNNFIIIAKSYIDNSENSLV